MDLLARLGWRYLGRWYFAAFLVFEFVSAYTIALGTVALLALYQEMTFAEALHIVLVAWACIAVGIASGWVGARGRAAPLFDWVAGDRGHEGAEQAWRTAVALPVDIVTR